LDERLRILLFVCFFNRSSDLTTEPKSTSKPNNKPEAVIKGRVVDSKGQGVAGVQVHCIYITKEDFPMGSSWSIITDSRGHYQFTVPALFTYKIEAGGLTSAHSESKNFNLKPNEIYEVENLIVRPTNNNCSGRVVYEDGRPAANLSYGYASENLFRIDPMNPPKTNSKGEFVIEHILPDELFSFWVFPKKNTFCVWKRLDPNSKNLMFTLKTSEYIELPSDWLTAFTHEGIAKDITFAKDSKIQFGLPDLYGNIISLQDQRFKNKAVLVNIYGSWCGGCRLEIPYLVEFKNKYQKDGLEIIGIAFERGSKEEQLQAVKEIAQEFKVNYPLLIGGFEEREKMGTVINGLELFRGYPTTLYIGRDGLVKHSQAGFWLFPEATKQWQLKLMEDHIRSLLSMPVN
jgi:thiol-disulfide isomerase/thioredoxin